MEVKPILYISPLPPPYGGIATWTQLIFKYGFPQLQPLSLVNTRLTSKRNIFEHAKFSKTEGLRFIKVIYKLLYELFFNRPRLIHLSCSLSPLGIFRDLLCLIVVKFFRLPIIVHFHGNLPDFEVQRFLGLSGFCLKKLINYATINIIENQFSEDCIKTKYLALNSHLLPNFVEDSLFIAEPKEKKYHAQPLALFAGGITRAKGALELLQLAKKCPHVSFHLYGKLHKDVETEFKILPVNLILHETVQRTLLFEAMHASDFLIFPSYSEGFPLTVVEAMAMGLPVIATNVGAIPEMIDEGLGGYLCSPGNVKQLEAAILQLLKNPQSRKKMGEYNQQKAYSSYRYSKVVLDLQNLYQQLQTDPAPCVG